MTPTPLPVFRASKTAPCLYHFLPDHRCLSEKHAASSWPYTMSQLSNMCPLRRHARPHHGSRATSVLSTLIHSGILLATTTIESTCSSYTAVSALSVLHIHSMLELVHLIGTAAKGCYSSRMPPISSPSPPLYAQLNPSHIIFKDSVTPAHSYSGLPHSVTDDPACFHNLFVCTWPRIKFCVRYSRNIREAQPGGYRSRHPDHLPSIPLLFCLNYCHAT